MLKALKTEKKVVGLKQCIKAITEEKVLKVYIANDADDHVKERILKLYNEKNIETIYVDSMEELGVFCGIEIGASVACIIK